jgi:S-formylglutathione hydrolase FrmB
MKIDDQATVLTALVVTLVATVLLARAWDRRRIIGRVLLVMSVLLTVTGTATLELNRLTETYPSWSSLLSRSPGDDQAADSGQPVGDSPRTDDTLPSAPASPAGTSGGRMVRFTVAGSASGLTLPLTAYLPAAYSSPQGRTLRFPVIEALHGYPGTPTSWFRRLDVKRNLDREIAAGRMAPTVVLFPYQTPDRLLDTECTDLVHGPKTETFLTVDVPRWAQEHLQIRTDQAAWGLIGYSAGAFCAMNLALRHPDRYTAGASLSGYADPGIKVGDGSEKTTNNIAWRLTHQPQPPVSLYVAWADDDADARNGSRQIVQLAKAPLTITTATVPHGGHSHAVWRQMEGPAFDWLSAHLARAEP